MIPRTAYYYVSLWSVKIEYGALVSLVRVSAEYELRQKAEKWTILTTDSSRETVRNAQWFMIFTQRSNTLL